MSDASLMYWQEKLGKTQPRVLRFEYDITGAKAVSALCPGMPVLETFDGGWTQAQIDDYLGTSSEFTAAQFDATSMGDDTFGGLVDMNKQCQKVLMMSAKCYSASNTLVERQVQGGSLADSTLETAIEVGADGNIGFKVDFGNTPDFDALTDGTIVIEIHWISK